MAIIARLSIMNASNLTQNPTYLSSLRDVFDILFVLLRRLVIILALVFVIPHQAPHLQQGC